MLESSHIFTLIVNAIFVKVLLTFPKIVVENSANAAWIQVLYITAVMLLFYCAVMKYYRRKQNFIEMASAKKWLKILVGIITAAILILNFVPVIRIYPETVKAVLLKETNTEIIVIAMAITVIIGARLGLSAIARIHRMFLPVAAVVLAGFMLFLIPFYKFEYIMPIFGSGAKYIFINGLSLLSLFSDLIIMNLLIPYCKNSDTAKRCGRIAIITAGSAATVITLVYCLTFIYPASQNFIIPMYQMARLVHLSAFFSRFEAFFEFVWSIMVFLYASLYLFMICYTIQITFSLRFTKPLIFPVGVIVFMISLLPDSMMDMLEIETTIMKYSYIPVFLMFAVFGTVSYIRERKERCKKRSGV